MAPPGRVKAGWREKSRVRPSAGGLTARRLAFLAPVDRGAAWLSEHGFDVPGAEHSEGVALLGQAYPSFGHSLGLAWENPSLVPGEEAVLVPGMVIAVEAEVGRPGAGTGAFEHNVLITEDGHEILTLSAPNVWWE